MKHALKILLGASCVAGVMPACGASNKDASEVAGMFSGASRTLQDRLESVCHQLRKNKEAPSTAGLELATLDSCEGAGENAISIKKYDGFRLQQYTISNGAETDKRRSSFRLQLWFNSNLVGLTKLVSNIKEMQESTNFNDAPVDKDFIENAAKFDVKFSDKLAVKLDDGPIKGGLGIAVSVDGLLKVAMNIRIDFTLIDNTVAIVIKTLKAEGIVQDFFLVIMLTPYAQDTYLDAIGSVKINEILDDAKTVDTFLPKLTETFLTGFFKLQANKTIKGSNIKKNNTEKSKAALITGASP